MHHADVAGPFAFSFSCASIFRRAASIISSRRRCRFACLSFLSADHAFGFAAESDATGSEIAPNFDTRL